MSRLNIGVFLSYLTIVFLLSVIKAVHAHDLFDSCDFCFDYLSICSSLISACNNGNSSEHCLSDLLDYQNTRCATTGIAGKYQVSLVRQFCVPWLLSFRLRVGTLY